MRYWGGLPVWDTSPAAKEFGGGFWRPPTGVQGWVDLRSPDQCAQKIIPAGYAFFVTPNAVNLGVACDNFGTDPAAVLTGIQKTALKTKLALPNNLAALDLKSAIWEAMTIQADPTGGRCMPLVPNGRRFELWLNGTLHGTSMMRDGTELEFAPVLDLLKRQYRDYRQQVLDGKLPPDHHRKILGYWVRKYGLPYHAFQPNDVPAETDLAPTTTLTDNFNRADSGTTMNTPSEGWSWGTLGSCVYGITSNHGYGNGSGGSNAARADSNLSGADHYAQCLTGSGSTYPAPGPTCRMTGDSTETFYLFRTADATTMTQFKCVAGSFTSLATPSESTALNKTLKHTVSGTTLTPNVNGSDLAAITDSAIASGVRCGVRSSYAGDTTSWVDDFVAADVSAASSIIPIIMHAKRQRMN